MTLRNTIALPAVAIVLALTLAACGSGAALGLRGAGSNLPGSLAITTTSLTGGAVGTAYTATVTATGGSGIDYVWSATGLPAGLSIAVAASTPSAQITGTPTASGSFSVNVTVLDDAANTISKMLSLDIAAPAGLTILTANLAAGQVGVAYLETITAAGGTAPYSWTLVSGSLPNGLSGVSATAANGTPGVAISGTPTVANAFAFQVQVTDAANATTTANLSITINDASTLTITTASALPDGFTGASYGQMISAAGGTDTQFTWNVFAGAMPSGVDISATGTPSAWMSGTPAATGDFTFTLKVQDSGGNMATKDFTLSIPSSSPWQATTTTGAPSSRTGHSAVWTGDTGVAATSNKMIVWGGWNGVAAFWDGAAQKIENGFLNDGGIYDPVADSWQPIATSGAPSARWQHSAVWTGDTGDPATSNRMIIWGGIYRMAFDPVYPSLPIATNNGEVYDMANDRWEAMNLGTAGETPSQRVPYSMTWTGNTGVSATSYKMLVWGGWRGEIDPANPPTTPTLTDGALSDGGVWDFTNGWKAMSDMPFFFNSRTKNSCAWTGTEFVVWGGGELDLTQYSYSTSAAYDIVTDSWTQLPDSAPTVGGRFDHSTVWTGTEIIVWGGNLGDGWGTTSTGGRYLPGTGWSETSLTGAPAIRYWQSAVWTGTEMIVWGGFDQPDRYFGAPLNSGGRYNPTNDSWTATPTTGAPTARAQHTAIWTGTSMIVWGGFEPMSGYLYAPFNTGGVYTP